MRASRRLLLFAAGTFFSCHATFGGESTDRIGRLLGYGWSDGYHACGADCYQLGENLPPLSYASQQSHYAVSHRTSPSRPSVAASCIECDQHGASPSLNSPHVIPMIEDHEVYRQPQFDAEPEELPRPLVEPKSPSDVDEARARTLRAYKQFSEASREEPVVHPKRIGAKTPQRLPTTSR